LIVPIYKLGKSIVFPDPSEAEDGIIAIGGDLSPQRLMAAYQSGIFPWYNDDEPLLWWSPDPRSVLFPDELKVSRSMAQLLKKKTFRVSLDTAFSEVIRACANVRYKDRDDTWINSDIEKAYTTLHKMGVAHSVEVWDEDGTLCGGLYGLAIGKVYFGESMFFTKSNASKYGFITLVRLLQERGFELIDCQVHNPHLESLGATLIPREIFLSLLSQQVSEQGFTGSWSNWLT
jgi:leucyl/phenylalanyl-tRNA---protein transferase